MSGARTLVTFVIPVRNDARRLDACLHSIHANRAPGFDVDVVVADNGSTDDSAAVARRHGATVLSLPGVRLGELRNRAAAAARGSLLAFVDADHEIAPGWVAAAVECMAEPQVVAAGAPCHPPQQSTWVQRMYDRLRRHPRGQEDVSWLGSGNMIVSRQAFDSAHGFDTSLETCEDVDLCRKLRATGLRILADERLRNVHYGDPRTLKAVFVGEMWRGRDNVRVSFRPPWDARTLVSAMIPATNFAAIGAATLGALTMSPAGAAFAAVAATVPATLIALRAAVLLRQRRDIGDVPQAVAVATAYEMGRAAAVVARGAYKRRRVEAAS